MSFNSFQANSISISNNGNTVECYDTNMEEKNVGCSSLRVRFRMITRKNDNFKARISSSISTSSMYSNSSSNNNNNNMLTNSSSLALNNPNKDIALAGSTSSLSSYTVNQNQNFLEIKQNNQSMNHAVFFYNNNQQQQHQNLQCKRYNHPVQSNNRELIESKAIPINIGINKSNPSSASTTSTTSSTTKTFRLTEDLKSNIHFDITLKPTFSIRDDRLDASNSNLRSSSCELNSSCSNFEQLSENNNNNNNNNSNKKGVVSVIRNSRQKEQLACHDSKLTNQNNKNKMYHHSSMIRLSINQCPSSNSSSGVNSPRNKSHTNLNHLEIPTTTTTNNTKIEENNNILRRVVSPFTYIETYSTRRQMSMSPHTSIIEPKQARILFFYL
jgi:hypothetical protein